MKKTYCKIFLFFHAKHVATSISKSFLYNISVQFVSKEKLKSKMARQKKNHCVPQTSGHHESDTICDAHRVYRIKVLMSFMSWSAHFKLKIKFYAIPTHPTCTS